MSAKSLQSCLTLCDPKDCSLPGSSVQGTLQTRTLERVAMPSSRGSPLLRDRTCISCSSCIAGRFFTAEPPGEPLSQALWYVLGENSIIRPNSECKGASCSLASHRFLAFSLDYVKDLYLIPLLGIGHSPTSATSNSQAPCGCPTFQLISDTVYSETASDSRG